MKNLRKALSLLVILAMSAQPAFAGLPPKESGYLVCQDSQVYGPGIRFFVGAHGFSWSNPANGMTICAAAPQWKVFTYNSNNRKYIESSLSGHEGYMLRSSVIFWGFSLSRIPLAFIESGTKYGAAVRIYKMKEKLSEKEKLERGIDTLRDCRYCVADTAAWKLPEQACLFMRRHYNLPQQAGFPLYMSVKRRTVNQFIVNSTKVEKTEIPLSAYRLPAGYKRALNDKEILRAGGEDSSMDTLLRDIDSKDF